MEPHITNDVIEDLVRYIYLYTNNRTEKLSLIDLCFANEIYSTKRFDSKFKLQDLTKYKYRNLHYKINDTYIEVFVYVSEDVDVNEMYQIIECNNFIQVLKFKQDEYEKRKVAVELTGVENNVFSFFDGYCIVVQTERKLDFDYIDLPDKLN